jgi:hypothetical protein
MTIGGYIPKPSRHSPVFYKLRNIVSILQDLTSFFLNFSIPESSIIIPVKLSPVLFQRLETAISMLAGSVPIKITSNSENASRFGLYALSRGIEEKKNFRRSNEKLMLHNHNLRWIVWCDQVISFR